MEGLASLIGESPAVEALRDSVRRLLHHPPGGRRLPSILIEGETGAGKGLLARIIHRAGPRAQGPFVDVNCAAIPDTLLEAELFGFERGAFTDARRAKPGLFQTAHRGMIFLDEVGLLPEGLQAKLLKVIEEREVRRLGSTRSEPVDAWVLSATNADLLTAVAERRFREDLYHRLAVIRLRLPSLRERGDDIVLLAEHFLARACEEYALPAITLGPDARAALLAYAWPGNIRELTNLMERVALLSERAVVTAAMLDLPTASRVATPAELAQAGRGSAGRSLDIAMRDHLLRVLGETAWNISRSAAVLGISRNTLRSRIERLGLHRSGERPALAPAVPVEPAPAPPLPDLRPVASTIPAPGPAVVRWERRRVTLLRAEIYPPPDAEGPAEASRALKTIMEKVRSFGGWTQDLAVTWIGAAFGVAAVEDGPRRAVHAAMAIQKAAERGRRGDGEPFAVRVGVHVAEFLVGQTGAGLELDADAKRREGATLASLIATAASDAIVATAAAAPFLERHFELTPTAGADAGYQLVGRERPTFAPGRRLARFVGRQQELTLIRSRLDSARAGHGQIVGIVGEAGIGKSRLLYELRQTLRGEHVTYLEGRCLSYGSAIPYLPVLEILRHALRLTDADRPETIVLRVQETLRGLGMAEDDAGYVLQLLGVKEGTERLGLLSPEAIQSRMVNVIREMTVRASHARPLVIAVEDVQWLDQASQALAALVESLEGVAVLVVLTYRPGWEPPWMRHSNVTRIGLPPLSEPDSLALVTSVLQTERLPEPLPQLILAKAEGNPFFLEELARVVTEQGVPLPALTVPASVHEVLLARIDRLGDVPRRLLQVASVIGRTIPLPLLAAVWEEPEGLEDALDALSRLELLYERPAEGGRMLVFKHALIQDVAYDSVLEGRRRALHAAVGRALAELHADRQDQILELLAHHFGRSNADGAAVDYAILAAEKAQRRWAPAEALAAFDAALSRLAGMPDTVANRLRRIDAILKQAEARFVLGRHAEQIQALEGIRELVEGEQATDPRRRAAWHYWMGFLHSLTGGRPEVPIAYCREASRISEAEGFDDLHAFAESCLAQVNVVAGRLRAAKAAGERALATFEAQGNVWWACRTLWQLNSAALYLGEWADSLDYCRRSLAHGEAVSDARLQLVALWRIGSTHIQRGNATEGLQWCRQAWALSPPPFDAHMIKSVEGYGLLKSGDPEAGVAALEEALAWFDMSRLRYTRSTTSLRLAEGYLALGQRQRARELLDEVLDTSRDLGYRHHEGVAERLVGDSLLDEDPAAARAHLDTAERILTEVEARNELAKALVSQAQLRRAAGDWAGARARLEHALEIFERLDSVDGSARVREELAAPEPPSPS